MFKLFNTRFLFLLDEILVQLLYIFYILQLPPHIFILCTGEKPLCNNKFGLRPDPIKGEG